MKWSPELVRNMEQELRAIPHGAGRRDHAEQLAESMGVHVSTLYKKLNITDGTKCAPRDPDISQDLIELVGRMKLEPAMYGRTERYMTTEDAIAILEQTGKVEQGLLKKSTVDRRLREAGWNHKRSYSRHEDDFSNQIHMLDWSVSEYFTYGGLNDGKHELVVDGSRGAWSYKNKDKPTSERLRLWVGSYIDTYSRAWVVRYFASPGESLSMACDMLEFMWQRTDTGHPFRHMPLETLKTDKGPLAHSKAFKRGLEFLHINFISAASKSDRLAEHQSMGKVENRFKTIWRKELRWALSLKKRGVKTVTLEDLNAVAHQHFTARMNRKHPVRGNAIKEVYEEGLLLNEQRTIDPDFDLRMLFFSEDTRKVSPLNDITINNQLYKVPEGYRDQRVYYVQFPDGSMKGMSQDRRETFELLPFDPAQEKGERLHTPTYKEMLHERGPVELDGNKIALAACSEKSTRPDNVHMMKPRESQEEPETPFQPKPREDVFLDWDLAKGYICECFNCRWADLADRTQQLFRDLFEIKKLSKQAVEELSQTAS